MVDLTGLQEDANLAANYMLSAKRSSDLKRQRAIWEFEACRCTSKRLKKLQPSRKSKLSIQGRTSMPRWDVPRQLWRLSITIGWPSRRPGQLGATNFKSWKLPIQRLLGENATDEVYSVHKTPQGTCKTHVHELEEQAIREESKSHHDFLSTCQAILLHASQSLKENLSTSYHVLLQRLPSSLQSAPFARTPQAEEQPSATASPRPEPKWSPWPESCSILCQIHGEARPWMKLPPKASQEGPSSSKRRETPNWFTSLKPSHADAFSHDSNPMKEARLHYFATHPCDWIHDSTNDLSNIFRELAEGCWPTRGIHPWNTAVMGWARGVKACQLCSYNHLPKGLRFLRAVSTMESPKVMGLKGIHDPDALWHCVQPTPTVPGVGRRGKMREPWLTIWGQPTTD